MRHKILAKKHGTMLRLPSSFESIEQGRTRVEELWRQFFSDPSQWWDHTAHKVNPKYPDFKHKKTGAALWIQDRLNPSWMTTDLASMTKGCASRSLHSWNTMISTCVKSNQGLDALKLYNEMQAEGVSPDAFTFGRVITACSSLMALQEGRLVHKQAIESGCESDVFIGNTLLDMYSKCGSIEDAEQVFYKMPYRNVVSWTAMLTGYLRCDQGHKALEQYSLMQEEGVKPNHVTFVVVLNACAGMLALEQGRRVHAQAIQSGCEADEFVASTLVDMYGKCGSILDASKVFHKMLTLDVVPCNAMLAGYVKCEQGSKALELFSLMQEEGLKPNLVTFVVALSACASIAGLEEGRHVHTQIIESGLESDVFVGSTLVDMYAKCGSLEDARKVFKKMPTRNVVSWNAMLAGYVKCEQGQNALEHFALMQVEGVNADPVTFVVVLNACASLLALDEGRHVHAKVIKSGFEFDVFVGSALVDMYAKCGSLEDAQRVFCRMHTRDVVCWTAMLTGYVKCNQGQMALKQFSLMQKEGVKPNAITFAVVLNACASIMTLEEGRHVHAQLHESGFEFNEFVGSALVDMYAKCGSIEEAQKVFHKMHTRDVGFWNAMLVGYVKCDLGQKALEQFAVMKEQGVKPNAVTFVGVLNACASLMALEEGRRIHAEATEGGCESDIFVGSTLVDMYAKCGSIEDAERVFYKMPSRDVVCWTAMLGGYAMHGRAKEALQLFQEMCEAGVEVQMVTFICLLSACSHGGLVEEGFKLFESMGPVYGISQTREHYACMVDLLGRVGRLDEAEALLKSKPIVNKDCAALRALLGACRSYGNVDMGERIAQQLLELEPYNAAGYVLLSNIYAAGGQWNSRDRIQELQKKRGLKKLLGRTWIEVDSQVHSFLVDDQTHPQLEKIHEELQRLFKQMEEAGYVPDTRFMLHDVEEEERVFHLCHHSEKLAIAFGLINTPPGTPLRIYKNLRVCVDCHTASKFMAKLAGRLIVVRDSNRFHYFKDGVCSCGDYW